MTREQAIALMNILAAIIGYISKFPLSFPMLHGVVGFELIGENVRREMNKCFNQSSNIDIFLKELQKKVKQTVSKENQKNMLTAYHTCMWLDQMLTYEDVSAGKLSIYGLIPLRAFFPVEIDTLNDNYEETGICINPKLSVYKASMRLSDGTEKERKAAGRGAFVGINGELTNISYYEWNNGYVVHNIIVPYEYREADGESNVEGNLKIGFTPVSDKADLIVPEYKNVREGKYTLRKMYIDSPNDEETIHARLKRGLELACENQVDIVFGPEMLGTRETERCTGSYNEFVRQIYSDAVTKNRKPPVITVLPSCWSKGTNSATIVYRDGRVLGRQKKYTPYVNFQSCSVEGIREGRPRELYLIHIQGVHRIAVSICAEFLEGFDSNLICGQLGATLIIVPSFSHGERDFVSKLGAFFPYGTSVIWGDCCGAVSHSPKIIGGCSIVGSNEIYEMGNNCNCGFSCGENKGCLFTIGLPFKVVYSKGQTPTYQPVRHILS